MVRYSWFRKNSISFSTWKQQLIFPILLFLNDSQKPLLQKEQDKQLLGHFLLLVYPDAGKKKIQKIQAEHPPILQLLSQHLPLQSLLSSKSQCKQVLS